MPGRALGLSAILAVTAAYGVTACGSGSDKPGPVQTGPGGGASGPGTGGAGVGGDATSSGSTGVGGNVIPDTDCVSPGGTSAEVYPGSAAYPAFGRLVPAGSRWAASSPIGWVSFGADGSNGTAPALVAPNFNRVVSDAPGFGVVASGNNLQYQRFDEDGGVLTAPFSVALGQPAAVTAVRTDVDLVVVWGDNTALRSRRLTPDNAFPGPSDTVAFGAFSTYVFLTSATKDGEVMVVYSGDAVLGANQTFSLVIDAQGTADEPKVLWETAKPHNVERVVPTVDGYVVLLTGEAPDNLPYLLRLDADGNRLGEPMALAGAQYAHDLAAVGDTVAVVASRVSGEPELRSFDASGTIAPLADWVCLDDPVDVGQQVAVAPDGAGFATLHQAPDGSIVLTRTDELGTGAP